MVKVARYRLREEPVSVGEAGHPVVGAVFEWTEHRERVVVVVGV